MQLVAMFGNKPTDPTRDQQRWLWLSRERAIPWWLLQLYTELLVKLRALYLQPFPDLKSQHCPDVFLLSEPGGRVWLAIGPFVVGRHLIGDPVVAGGIFLLESDQGPSVWESVASSTDDRMLDALAGALKLIREAWEKAAAEDEPPVDVRPPQDDVAPRCYWRVVWPPERPERLSLLFRTDLKIGDAWKVCDSLEKIVPIGGFGDLFLNAASSGGGTYRLFDTRVCATAALLWLAVAALFILLITWAAPRPTAVAPAQDEDRIGLALAASTIGSWLVAAPAIYWLALVLRYWRDISVRLARLVRAFAYAPASADAGLTRLVVCGRLALLMLLLSLAGACGVLFGTLCGERSPPVGLIMPGLAAAVVAFYSGAIASTLAAGAVAEVTGTLGYERISVGSFVRRLTVLAVVWCLFAGLGAIILSASVSSSNLLPPGHLARALLVGTLLGGALAVWGPYFRLSALWPWSPETKAGPTDQKLSDGG